MVTTCNRKKTPRIKVFFERDTGIEGRLSDPLAPQSSTIPGLVDTNASRYLLTLLRPVVESTPILLRSDAIVTSHPTGRGLTSSPEDPSDPYEPRLGLGV